MAGKKIHDSETKIHLIQCAKKKNLWKKGLWGRLSAESARRRV